MCLQKGVVAIPKSTNVERMATNIDVFDFALSDEDMQVIENYAVSVLKSKGIIV